VTNRIDVAFASQKAAGRTALVPYVTVGDPTIEHTVPILRALVAAGADVIELGVPFSDPMADGPVIQASSQRALDAGMNFDRLLELVARAKARVPLVLFSYLNPVLAAGKDALTRAADAGFHGVLLTDLPVGADPSREAWVGASPLEFIRLVAPTTPPDRMKEIASHGSGFVYLISRLGVTGMGDTMSADLPATVKQFFGLDAALEGTWQIEVGTDPAQPDVRELVATVTGPTFGLQNLGLQNQGTHITARLTCSDAARARIGNLLFHYNKGVSD